MGETILILIGWPLAGVSMWFCMQFFRIEPPKGKIANILLIMALPLIVTGLLFLALLILLWLLEVALFCGYPWA